jgi:hypothetical protein
MAVPATFLSGRVKTRRCDKRNKPPANGSL